MPRFFIDRPIFAWVVAILITLSGTVAIFNLPVSAYPPIAPPQVSIKASYPGASAEVVEKTVTSVIEQQLTGIDNLLYFDSTSRSNGTVQITLTFLTGTNPDIAAVQVQNRLSVAEPRLPAEVVQNGVTVAKANNDFLMVVALKSTDPSYDTYALNNLISAQVLDPIQRLPGVGGANLFGASYAMRIWLDPDRLHGYHLSASQALAAVTGPERPDRCGGHRRRACASRAGVYGIGERRKPLHLGGAVRLDHPAHQSRRQQRPLAGRRPHRARCRVLRPRRSPGRRAHCRLRASSSRPRPTPCRWLARSGPKWTSWRATSPPG